MKKMAIVIGCACLALVGCRTYTGGAGDDYSTIYQTGVSSWPKSSPSFRPGMDPYDLRDPNALTRPQAPGPPPLAQPPP
jgi:hypothetical protein